MPGQHGVRGFAPNASLIITVTLRKEVVDVSVLQVSI